MPTAVLPRSACLAAVAVHVVDESRGTQFVATHEVRAASSSVDGPAAEGRVHYSGSWVGLCQCVVPTSPSLTHPFLLSTLQVPLEGIQPLLLHGGGLLGVVLNKPVSHTGGAPWNTPFCTCRCPRLLHQGARAWDLATLLCAHPPAGRAMRFVSWNGFAALGPEVPEPQWVR